MPQRVVEGSTRSWRAKPTDKMTFYPRVFGRRGAVAAEHYSATLAGIEILQRGGNAVDAACAAALVEGVVNPHMHTIGGELPMLISVPGSSDVVCINGNMAAPGKATPQAFPKAPSVCATDDRSRRCFASKQANPTAVSRSLPNSVL